MFLFKQKEGDNIFFRERENKDITKLYNIVDVADGSVITNKGKVNIYEVKPCTVIGESDEINQNIYNAYLVLLRMITFNYQIVIKTGKTDFNKILNILNKNIYCVDNTAQKRMIEKYKKYLLDLSKDIQVFTKTFYIITKKLTIQEENQLVEAVKLVKYDVECIRKNKTIQNIVTLARNKNGKLTEAQLQLCNMM